jgi:hypothetical protein
MTKDFNLFFPERAELVERAMEMLVQGDSPQLESLWTVHLADKTQATVEVSA